MLERLRDKFPSFSFQLSTAENKLEKWQIILLSLLTFFCCYYGLGSYAILDMNEGLYAEIAREMLIDGHFIIPHLNGLPYLEKPPLLYWLIALSYKFFGINAFAARVIPSTFTALTVLSVIFAAKKLLMLRTGFITAIILLTSIVFIMIGRVVFFDMTLTFWVVASLFSFYFWQQENHTRYLYLSYTFLGLAVLTKGFLALVLLPAIMVVFLFLIKAEKSRYLALVNKKALGLLCLIILPWHLLAMVSFSQFTWEYFINNQLLRFFNTGFPHDYHTGPFYFYIPRLIAYILPWSIFLPFIFWPLHLKRPFDPLKAFLWTWFFVMLVFFSLAGDKGDCYLVIGIVPLAHLLAQRIESWFVEEKSRWLNLGFYVVVLGLSAAGILSLLFYTSSRADFASQLSGDKIPFILTSPVLFLTTSIVVYGALGFYLCRKNKTTPMIPFLLMAGLIIPLLLFFLTVRERTQFMYSQIALAKYVASQYEHRPVYLYQDFEAISSFVFYNREPSIIIDSQSADLYFGSQTKAGKDKFISLDNFLNYAKTTHLYVVMRANKLDKFEKTAGKDTFCTVQRNGNVLLLSNAAEDCRATIEVGEQKALDLDFLKKNDTKKPSDKDKP